MLGGIISCMVSDENCTYELMIDRDCVIKFVNEAWLDFASSVDAHSAVRENVLHRSLFDFIEGVEVKMFYKHIIEKVRIHNEASYFPFRCDSPYLRRYLEMKIHPGPNDWVCFSSRIVKLESRLPIRLLDYSVPRTDEIISICSICKCVKITKENWVEIEEAIKIMNIFGESAMPMLSHGLCPICSKTFREQALGLINKNQTDN